ncbi:transcription termination factor NusA [Planctomycetaceae bacterium]|nr:transcription termination factor NusA [Planctomycetaceae bacterium]
MNGPELLRLIDTIHRDKNIDKSIVFEGIEQAILSAARRHYGEESEVEVHVDRTTGEPTVHCPGVEIAPDDLGTILGRISTQTAKQVMIQKFREAERDSLYIEYEELRGTMVTGTVTRFDGGAATVNLGKVEAFLPRSEQIPGESHRVNERVRAVIIEVRKAGSRVKIILSRKHPDLVQRLFEREIPEVAESIIEIQSLAREAGYRSKVAVSCYDNNIDCVGACVGVRGSRIKNIVEELAGERIDIVRWNESLPVLVPNAMQPADVDDVIVCASPSIGKVLVLVDEDQLSLAIGKRGQNVRLASKLVGWDIEVMTQEELHDQLEQSTEAFAMIPGITADLAEELVGQGFFSFYDLSVIEPEELAEMGGLSEEQCNSIIAVAEGEAERLEAEETQRRQEQRAARERERQFRTAAEEYIERGETPPAELLEALSEETRNELLGIDKEDESDSAEAGTDEAGTDEAGTDEAGTDEAVADEAVADEAVADEAVADEAVADEEEIR